MSVFARGRFFEGDVHGVGQVAAAKDLTPAALLTTSATAEDIAKNIAEAAAETTKPFGTTGPAHVRVHTGVTVLVVSGFFLGVREHLVSLFGFFEFLFGGLGRITLVAVGVVLHGELAVRLFDLVVGGVFGHAQHVVKVSFGHGEIRSSV